GAPIRLLRYTIDPTQFGVLRAGDRVPVEPRPFDLLQLLAPNIGRTVTRDEIFNTVWQDRIVSDAALSSQIRAARRALGDDGIAQQMIATVHGRGFRLRGQSAAPAEAEVTPAVGRTGLPRVAVRPCASLDQDGRGTVLAQGITEDMITALSKTRWLCVIPRTTASALQRTAADEADIVQKTGADYLVSGTVRRDGNRVRITVQTIDA